MSKRSLDLIEKEKKERTGTLNLANCDLVKLPPSLLQCPWLWELWLHGNDKLVDISLLKDMTDLQKLDISSTQVSDLSALSNLSSLRMLNFSSSQIFDISPLQGLRNLRQLTFSSTQINDLSPLKDLHRLQLIDASSTQISDLSPLRDLKELHVLDFSSTHISDLVPMQKLQNLRILDVSNTSISDLNPLQDLQNLQRLYIHSTQAFDLSPILPLINTGKQVKWGIYEGEISVYDCPLTIPPPEIVQKGNAAILRYFDELQKEKPIPFREAKLLILGAGGVGKTSLLTKLQNPTNSLPNDSDTTVGISICVEPLHYSIEGDDYTLYAWDFGGQDAYHPIHQFFLTKRSVYVLMEDGREKKSDFNYWLQVQELLAGDSPVLIVQNIKNDSRSEIPINDLRAQFSNVAYYLEIDLRSVSGSHTDYVNLVKEIKHRLITLPHVGQLWPKTRFNIREDLETLATKQDYITLDEYRSICNRHRYKDAESQDSLLAQLHDLGVVLYFAGEPVLEDIVILRPQWATDAVYAILDHTKLHREKRGHFTWVDLKTVWADAKYQGKYFELIELMCKFELIYELPEKRPRTYIVPLLLPYDKPVYDWDKESNLQFRYEYDFLPKGILSRLIVRMHPDIEDPRLVWKGGVVFCHKNNRAEVIEDHRSQCIIIREKGPESGMLMSMIIKILDSINNTYHFCKQLKVTKKVPCNCISCVNIENPHFFNYEDLVRRITELRKNTIECTISAESVPVRPLLERITNSPSLDKENIRQLLENDKLDEALNILKLYDPNKATSLLYNLNSTRRSVDQELVSHEVGKQVGQRIVQAILNWLEEVENI